jgi:hypothetical protein
MDLFEKWTRFIFLRIGLKHTVRATRLGEVSPIGRVFTLGSFLNDRISPNVGRHESYVIIVTKNGLGYTTYGLFFSNSSGHPAPCQALSDLCTAWSETGMDKNHRNLKYT